MEKMRCTDTPVVACLTERDRYLGVRCDGTQWWVRSHQHCTAGHLIMARGNDYLLVSAAD